MVSDPSLTRIYRNQEAKTWGPHSLLRKDGTPHPSSREREKKINSCIKLCGMSRGYAKMLEKNFAWGYCKGLTDSWVWGSEGRRSSQKKTKKFYKIEYCFSPFYLPSFWINSIPPYCELLWILPPQIEMSTTPIYSRQNPTLRTPATRYLWPVSYIIQSHIKIMHVTCILKKQTNSNRTTWEEVGRGH